MLFQLREETTCFGVDKQTEYLMFVFVNANAQLLLKWATKKSPLLQIVLLLPLKFVYIHHLLVSRPIVLKSLYLTKRNAVWESLVICRACHHEGFLKFGDSTSVLASRQLKSERNARQVSKAYTILQRKDILAIRFWKLDIFFSFLIFSFFLFIGQTAREDSESVDFIDFFQRAATSITELVEFYFTTGYKVYSVSSQTKFVQKNPQNQAIMGLKNISIS